MHSIFTTAVPSRHRYHSETRPENHLVPSCQIDHERHHVVGLGPRYRRPLDRDYLTDYQKWRKISQQGSSTRMYIYNLYVGLAIALCIWSINNLFGS